MAELSHKFSDELVYRLEDENGKGPFQSYTIVDSMYNALYESNIEVNDVYSYHNKLPTYSKEDLIIYDAPDPVCGCSSRLIKKRPL